jgi:PHD/YefM family antitoxin component YafN of YafNO toxin-antitoxin module
MEHYIKIEINHSWSGTTVTDADVKINFTNALSNNDYFDIDTSGYTPKAGDKIYFMPGVNVPRVKLKDLILKDGIKVVRNPDEANIIISATDTIPKISSRFWSHPLPVNILKFYVEEMNDVLDHKHIEDINSALEFYTKDIVLCDWATVRNLTDSDLPMYQDLIKLPEYDTLSALNGEYFYKIDEDYKELYDKVKNTKHIHESCLLEILNGPNAVVIDTEMYEQLKQMFESSDNDNHILAMEIMANCKYKESILHLEMLFFLYADAIYSKSSRNHVNFKSLLSYLEKTSSIHTTLDIIIKSLKEKNVLDKDKVDVLLKELGHFITSEIETRYKLFKVKQLTLHEDILEKLGGYYAYDSVVLAAPVEESIIIEHTEPLIAIEEVNEPEIELIELEFKEDLEPVKEQVLSNNNQITQTNDTDDFEWF